MQENTETELPAMFPREAIMPIWEDFLKTAKPFPDAKEFLDFLLRIPGKRIIPFTEQEALVLLAKRGRNMRRAQTNYWANKRKGMVPESTLRTLLVESKDLEQRFDEACKLIIEGPPKPQPTQQSLL